MKMSRNLSEDDPSDCQPPGHLKFCKKTKTVLVKCADDNYLVIEQLCIGRRKAMSAAGFNDGFLGKISESERHFD